MRVILSDRDILKAVAAGRVGIDPFDEADVQPSSVDLHVDRLFRTFHNHRHSFIDVRKPMEDLTEMVEVAHDEAFILHPGEFVLGSTLEFVRLPDDLVARLEGKSSLGRLGLLIHSSLPGDETVLFLDEEGLRQRPIKEIVRKSLPGCVVSFDPGTFEVGYHEVTGHFESSPDRIFEVVLQSGRKVSLTGGHDLFTLDSAGTCVRTRVRRLEAGTIVAIAGTIPDPPPRNNELVLLDLAAEADYGSLVCGGPTVSALWASSPDHLAGALRTYGMGHARYWRGRSILPAQVVRSECAQLGRGDWVAVKGGRHRLPAVIELDPDVAWLLGLFVAEGSSRRKQITLSNTDQAVLDRAQAVLARLGLPAYRMAGGLTCCSGLLSRLMGWLQMGTSARSKRIPSGLLGWPSELLDSFLDGFVQGDGSREATRVSLWTSSDGLVGDLFLVCTRLGRRSAASLRKTTHRYLWQISVPHREHKMLTSAPLCTDLLRRLRAEAGISQRAAAGMAGFRHATQLNNLETGDANAVRISTLRRLRAAYTGRATAGAVGMLDRIVDGDVRWDRVAEVRDTGRVEPVFDLEVRPHGRRIENFVAGRGGVFVSNTAGYVDPGFEGHLTLELSNVANLPITIYPGMKIGQISFFRLTSPADNPYGSAHLGSKYQGQRGPTPSRYHENFDR